MKALDKVLEYIKKENMISTGDRIVLGVSGGADSVCLLRMLDYIKDEYGLELIVVNVEHGIRGQESLDDTSFVEQLCLEKNISYRSFSYDVPELAKQWGISVEEAGRRVRYQAFYQVSEERSNSKIAVAHNANDNAETILHNIARGTGLAGITGIPACRDQIIRPLLCLSRQEIEDYLAELGQNFRNDSTNDSLDYTRNRIRHNIISQLLSVNEGSLRHINDLSREAGEIESYLNNLAKEIYDRASSWKEHEIHLKADELIDQPDFLKGKVVRHAISKLTGSLRDITRTHLTAVLELLSADTGKQLNLPEGLIVRKSYDKLIFTQEDRQADKQDADLEDELELSLTGRTRIGNISLDVSFPEKKNYIIPKSTNTKGFDYDKIKGGLKLRHRRTGDTIIIDSQGRRTKLKDYLINEKIPAEDRDRLWLLCDGQEIIWIIGYRISEAYKIDDNTERILQIEVTGRSNGR